MYRITNRHMQGNSTTTVPRTRDRKYSSRDDKTPRQNFSVTLRSDDRWRQGYSISLNRTILHNYLRYAIQSFPINWQPERTFRLSYKTKPHTTCGPDSTGSKELRTGCTVRGSNPAEGEIFLSPMPTQNHVQWLFLPFPGRKAAEAWGQPSTPA